VKRVILAAVIVALAAISLPLSTLAYHHVGRTIIRPAPMCPAKPSA
jgi:hypothetical protein